MASPTSRKRRSTSLVACRKRRSTSLGSSEIKIEDNGDKPGDNTNMVVDCAASGSDVDKTMVVDGAESGSDGNNVVSAVATPQSGSAAGDGVSSAPTLHAGLVDAPSPPPGNWGFFMIQHHNGFLLPCTPLCRLLSLTACTMW